MKGDEIVDIEQLDLILADYEMDMLLPRTYFLSKKKMFEKISYSRWGIEKLRQYLVNGLNGNTRASINYYISATGKFMSEMDKYSRLNKKNSFMFSMASDISADILDLFMAMK